MPNRHRKSWYISTLDNTESPRDESVLFVVEMLERSEIQSSEEEESVEKIAFQRKIWQSHH